MRSSILKPENALKQAEELVAINQPLAALQSLHELVVFKKCKNNHEILENVMMKYVALAVEMKRGRMAKEALLHFKNTCQNTNITSIEIVVKQMVELAETKASSSSTQSKDNLSLPGKQSLETELVTVLREESKERADRMTLEERFLWEVYRLLLDVLKHNGKLEKLYFFVAKKAFDFCSKHGKKSELCRLCEMLRIHLYGISKAPTNQTGIQLDNADSLLVQLELRFIQLNQCMKFELWKEAVGTIEDIYMLFTLLDHAPSLHLLVNYYESLAKIFRMYGNELYHTAAWGKLLSFVSEDSQMDKKRHRHIVLSGVLASLSIPPDAQTDSSTDARFMPLLGLKTHPSRTLLVKSIRRAAGDILPKPIRDLYLAVEKERITMSFCHQCVQALERLKESSAEPFVHGIERVILRKFIDQISKTFSRIRFGRLMELVKGISCVSTLHDLSWFMLEKWKVLIDHKNQMFIFRESSRHPFDLNGARIELIHLQSRSGMSLKDREAVDQEILEMVQSREQAHQKREKRMQMAREAREIQFREQQQEILVEQEKERARQADIHKQRDRERLELEMLELQKEEKKRLIEQVNRKLEIVGRPLKMTEALKLNREEILREQGVRLEEGRKAMEARFKTLYKRIDHRERALRLEERQVLEKDREIQKKRDQRSHELCNSNKKKMHRERHDQYRWAAERFKEIEPYFQEYRHRRMGRLKGEMQERVLQNQESLRQAKDQRRAQVLEHRYQTLLAKEKEEQQKQLEMQQQKEEEERLQMLDRAAEIQRQKNLEIEQRLEARRKLAGGRFESFGRFRKTGQ